MWLAGRGLRPSFALGCTLWRLIGRRRLRLGGIRLWLARRSFGVAAGVGGLRNGCCLIRRLFGFACSRSSGWRLLIGRVRLRFLIGIARRRSVGRLSAL